MPQARGELTGGAAKGRDPTLELFDVLGRRWAIRVVWELGTGGPTYRELAARIPDMSTSVLTQRLRDLRAARLVENERGSGYRLTVLGHELLGRLQSLSEWAEHAGFTTDAGAD